MENLYYKPETSGQGFVLIITGDINKGKTTKLLSTYNEIGRGDGFINLKVFAANLHIGQTIVRLSTGEKECFSFKEGFIPPDWDEAYRYGVYSFSKKGLMFADKIIDEVMEYGIEPVFIDEIGPLELQKEGFYDVFKMLLKARKVICVTVRSSCVQRVIREFDIERYRIIEVNT